jgi:hypothetical protein
MPPRPPGRAGCDRLRQFQLIAHSPSAEAWLSEPGARAFHQCGCRNPTLRRASAIRATCRCPKPCHPMRLGRIRGPGRRAGRAAGRGQAPFAGGLARPAGRVLIQCPLCPSGCCTGRRTGSLTVMDSQGETKRRIAGYEWAGFRPVVTRQASRSSGSVRGRKYLLSLRRWCSSGFR